MGKRLVNWYCPVRKLVLGDRNLTRSLKSKVLKDNYVSISEDRVFKPFNKKFQKGQRKPQFSHNIASIVKKSITQN